MEEVRQQAARALAGTAGLPLRAGDHGPTDGAAQGPTSARGEQTPQRFSG